VEGAFSRFQAGMAIRVGSRAVCESCTNSHTGAWQAGQHTNVATASGSFTDHPRTRASEKNPDWRYPSGRLPPG
jgi:hypothetical protein